jgi:hypothetical protein
MPLTRPAAPEEILQWITPPITRLALMTPKQVVLLTGFTWDALVDGLAALNEAGRIEIAGKPGHVLISLSTAEAEARKLKLDDTGRRWRKRTSEVRPPRTKPRTLADGRKIVNESDSGEMLDRRKAAEPDVLTLLCLDKARPGMLVGLSHQWPVPIEVEGCPCCRRRRRQVAAWRPRKGDDEPPTLTYCIRCGWDSRTGDEVSYRRGRDPRKAKRNGGLRGGLGDGRRSNRRVKARDNVGA